MRFYILVVETMQCLDDDCGASMVINGCEHATPFWVPTHWSMRESVVMQHMTRMQKQVNAELARGWKAHTGRVEIRYADVDTFQPALSDAELAAYKIGGTEAIRRLRRGLEVERRKQERAAARATKRQKGSAV